MVVIYLLLALVAIVAYFINKIRQKVDLTYWKKKGVAELENHHLFFGDTKELNQNTTHLSEVYQNFYKKFKKRGEIYGGIYNHWSPELILVDPNIIRLIASKDSHHFTDHYKYDFGPSLMFKNVFHMRGDAWKDMRRKLTPTFTSGKMKMMFDVLQEKTIKLTELMGKVATSKEPTELKSLLARFTTDVIGSVGFGIEVDSLNNENSDFYTMGQQIFQRLKHKPSPSLLKAIFMLLGIARFRFNYNFEDIDSFFREMVTETINYREKKKVIRKDFVHLMIQLKNNGTITDIINDQDIYKKSGDNEAMSLDEIAGQCLLFFIAGFETSSTTMSFALLELAKNQDVQDKLRSEIQDVLDRYNGKMTYDALQEMTYCENVIEETLRKYPPLAIISRVCTKEYTIPDTNVVIEKNIAVQLPVFAIQNDPDYFPEPEKFKPERFSKENRHNILDYTYFPFGEGPRQCLGLRFGMMQSKAGVASLINRYKFTLNEKTQYPPIISPIDHVMTVQGGIWLDAQALK